MSIPTAQQSLYEQLGGKPAVEAAVDLFYSKVLADNRINHYFANIDMGKQIGMQRAFLTKVFGGPSSYDGMDMRKGHSHLQGLNDSHFNAVVEKMSSLVQQTVAKWDDAGLFK